MRRRADGKAPRKKGEPEKQDQAPATPLIGWVRRRAIVADVVEYVESFASERQIDEMLRSKWGIVGTNTRKSYREKAHNLMREQDAARQEAERPKQVANLYAMLRRVGARILRAEQEGKVATGLYQADARYRELLAKLTGTEQPAQVDLNVRMNVTVHEALVGTMASLDEAQAAALLEEEAELQRLAARGRELEGEVVSVTPADKRLPDRSVN